MDSYHKTDRLSSSSSSLSFKCALRESGCRIGCEPTKMSRDHFWRSISSDTNVEVIRSTDIAVT